MSVLDVRSVSKSFGAIRALSDVSLTVAAGEVVGLMGDNGAGKSTMVKLIAGNFPPSDGEIAVDGKVCLQSKPIDRCAIRHPRRLSRCAQEEIRRKQRIGV